MALTFSQATLDLQKELLAAGYDPGPLDGLLGPKTQAAIDAQTAANDSGSTGTTPAAEDPVAGGTVGEGGTEASRDSATGILAGGQTFKIGRQGEEPLYFQAYRIEGTTDWAMFQFESEASMVDFFGPDGPPNGTTFFSEETYWLAQQSGQFTVAGDASELAGLPGDFNGLYNRTLNQALIGAGVTDPTIRGKLLADPEVKQILTTANLGQFSEIGITDDQLKAQLRNTDVWKNDLYAGIEFFYNRGDNEPEAAWRQYQSNVRSGLDDLGTQKDPDGSYTQTIGDMLNSGVSDVEFLKFLPTAIKIQENPGYKAQVDAWVQYEGLGPLTDDQFIDLLEGTTTPEIEAIVEKANLAYAAEQAGIDIPVAEIQKLASDTDLSGAEALAAFNAHEAQLLRIGSGVIESHGITKLDFLDVAAGRKPRSGKSAGEVEQIGRQLGAERAAADDPDARFFLGFNDRGSPVRQGLGSLAAEGG